MKRMQTIQLQASVQEPIGNITNSARSAVSRVCLGIDDMRLLGSKALVIRAEIYPEKLPALYAALTSIGVKLSQQSLPDIDALKAESEYPITLQITSFSDETDGRANIPKVPG